MAQLIEFEGATHEFPDDFTDSDISGALRKASTPTGQANRALEGTGLAVSQPKPPKVPGLTPRLPNSELPGYREAEAWEKEQRGKPDQSFADTAGDVAKHVGKTLVSPITGIPGAAKEVYDWATRGFKPPVLQGNGALAPPSYAAGSPLDQASGNAMLAAATMPGTKEAVGRGTQAVSRTARGAAQGAWEGLGEKSVSGAAVGSGAGYLMGGPRGAAIGGTIGGALPMVRGAIQGGVEGYRNTPPPLPPRPSVAAPPLRGSSIPPKPPSRPQVAPPPIQGSSIPPAPPVQARAPIPPLRGSSLPPELPPQAQVAPPPLRGSSIPPPQPVPRRNKIPRLQGSNTGPEQLSRPTAAPPPLRWNPPVQEGGPPNPPAMGPTEPPSMPRQTVQSPAPKPAQTTAAAAVTEQGPLPPRMVTSDEVRAIAKETGIAEAEAQRQVVANGYQIVNRGELFRMTHGFPGMDHAALQDIARLRYRVDSMAKLTEGQMLELYQDLASQQGVRATGTAKTQRKTKFTMARGGVVAPKPQATGRRSRRGHFYGKPTAAMKAKQSIPNPPKFAGEQGPPEFPFQETS